MTILIPDTGQPIFPVNRQKTSLLFRPSDITEISTSKAIRISTPLGEMLLIANEQGLTHALFTDTPCPYPISLEEAPEDPLLQKASQQITQYFHGMRRQFTIPLCPEGSDFDLRVWDILLKVSFGSLTTYGRVAQILDVPKAARAVGAACGRNSIAILIPCHRVVGSTHNLVGYAGGLHRKKSLLNLEKAT